MDGMFMLMLACQKVSGEDEQKVDLTCIAKGIKRQVFS